MLNGPSDNAVMLPSDVERRQIFHWLQKMSSATAWRRIAAFYKSWAETAGISVREADERGWGDKTSIHRSEYLLILKGLAHCEAAVDRLAKGDKRALSAGKYDDIGVAGSMLYQSVEKVSRVEDGENGIDERHTPRWEEFCDALSAACDVWEECAAHILERRSRDESARTSYNLWLEAELKTLPFPNQLKPLPNPIDSALVYTGGYFPCSGIWEPVDAAKPSFRSWIARTPKPQPPFKIVGAMNYMHERTRAPQVRVESEYESFDLDTAWRLLWRDDRYKDGTIPEEEVGYQFIPPKKKQPPRFAVYITKETLRARTGDPAPAAGEWIVEERIFASVTLQKGQHLPPHEGREVGWVRATYYGQE